jgi:predicted MFS family arabinose efflux permease
VLLRGALINLAAPLQSSFTMSALPPRLRGSGNAMILLVANVSRAAGTLAGGVLIARAGYGWPALATSGLYAGASALFWWWFRPRPAGPAPGLDVSGLTPQVPGRGSHVSESAATRRGGTRDVRRET